MIERAQLEVDSSEELAKLLRHLSLRMVHRARGSHIGGCLSLADILAVLYHDTMRVDPARPDWPERDLYFQSKGHASAVLYACLAVKGFFDPVLLEDFCADGGSLGGHVTCGGVPGVEFSTGSLGHALPVAAGAALMRGRLQRPGRIYVVLSDGECDEGTVWEAVLFAAHHRLDNLAVVIDYNKIQSFGHTAQVMNLDPLADKWIAFGWNAVEVDGHDHDALRSVLTAANTTGMPCAIIAHTVKGKGVDFMEDRLEFHYRPPSDEELVVALRQVEAM